MARIRTIKPEFYSDPDLGRLPLEARYLYQGMWCFADDEGRLPGDPRLLKSQVFPYDDKLTVRKVDGLIDALSAGAKVLRYAVGGVAYLLLPNFHRHQKINRPQPAKYPAPPVGAFTEHSVNEHGTLKPLPISDPNTYPTPPNVDDDVAELLNEIFKALRAAVWRPDLVRALEEITPRLSMPNRDGITSPVKLVRKMCDSYAQARSETEQADKRRHCETCGGNTYVWNEQDQTSYPCPDCRGVA